MLQSHLWICVYTDFPYTRKIFGRFDRSKSWGNCNWRRVPFKIFCFFSGMPSALWRFSCALSVESTRNVVVLAEHEEVDESWVSTLDLCIRSWRALEDLERSLGCIGWWWKRWFVHWAFFGNINYMVLDIMAIYEKSMNPCPIFSCGLIDAINNRNTSQDMKFNHKQSSLFQIYFPITNFIFWKHNNAWRK